MYDQLKAFSATRCEWMYSIDASLVAALKKAVHHVGLALSPANPRISHDSGAAFDLNGNLAHAPWMPAPFPPWISIFRPDSRTAMMKMASADVAIGVDSMQFDDPELEYGVLGWAGGDFSPEALSAFGGYCKTSPAPTGCSELAADNYDIGAWIRRRVGTTTHIDWGAFRARYGTEPAWQAWSSFLKSSSREFLSSIRQYLHSQERPLPLSVNTNNPLPTTDQTFILDATDYLECEIYSLTTPYPLYCFHACAAAWQLPFVPCIVPVSTVDTQWGIALGYALGDTPRVPYDIYIGAGLDRYFGTVADYGYLFSFVRANAQYFDDYEEIADIVFVMDENALTYAPIYLAAKRSLDLGITFRFTVRRPNGTVTANRSASLPPQVAVAINGSLSTAGVLYPSIPALSSQEFGANPIHPALTRVFRIVTPNPQKVVAIPRVNANTQSLIVHVVDATNSGNGFTDEHMEVIVPQPYWPYVKDIQSATLIRPNGDPLQITLTISQDEQCVRIRVPLAGILGWGIVIFGRH
jgi:hypothetical protein